MKRQDFKNYILYVGNAYPHKNLDRLIEACKDMKLVLVGPNDFFYSKIKSNTNLIIKHNISDIELSKLYKNANLFVMPSLMEGFGLTILEAMQYNIPIAASNISSFKEIAEESIDYFDPENINDMRMVISKTYKKKRIDYKKILNKFNWEFTANQTLKEYENCLGLRLDK